MSELDKLIEALEAGDEPTLYAALRAIASAAHDRGEYWPAHDATKAFDGSLDAALRLHTALLPGWNYCLQNDAANVWKWVDSAKSVWEQDIFNAEIESCPARAWLLAILRAVRAAKP